MSDHDLDELGPAPEIEILLNETECANCPTRIEQFEPAYFWALPNAPPGLRLIYCRACGDHELDERRSHIISALIGAVAQA